MWECVDCGCTFRQAAAERHGAGEQDGESTEGEEGEAEGAGEVDLERWGCD